MEQPITRTVVLDANLAPAKRTTRVQVRRISMQPGTVAGLHFHNGPVVGTVVTGSVVYQIEGEPETVLRPGDVFFEPEDAPIARFDATEEGAVFLGYFLLDEDEEPEIRFADAV